MYFVVFFVGIRENRTVPHAWIRNVNDYIESFINNGLNRNRLYFCFWTDHPDAFDDNGTPRATYKINHQASVRNDFPHEGFYRCHIKKFHCKFFLQTYKFPNLIQFLLRIQKLSLDSNVVVNL